MKPKAIRNPFMVRGTDGLLRVEMVDAGREFVLDSLAELVWDLSDGSYDIEALVQAADRALDRVVKKEEVFSALDFLADAGLIEERVAPPVAEGNVSRRKLLAQIAPALGVAAWMMSGGSGSASGFFQWSESGSKEDSNKEYNRKSDSREQSNKEYNNKTINREQSTKEYNRKVDSRESGSKEGNGKNRDRETDDKLDWNRQQDAEKHRKSDLNRMFDEINESARKHDVRVEQATQKMRASWPRLYQVVSHKLSDFPELRDIWAKAAAGPGVRLTADNYAIQFQQAQSLFFGLSLRWSTPAVNRFNGAGFEVLPFDLATPPLLAGDSQKKTRLVLVHVLDPAIGNNWRNALNADNLRFEFYDAEAAYQFLSSRRAAGTQTQR